MKNACLVFQTNLGAGVPALFPPDVVVQVKSVACQIPATLGLPLSRLSNADIAREVIRQGVVASISGTTVWRWLREDAIKPWQFRSWIWPRDPLFAEKAERVLDLYQGHWEGLPLGKSDYVISTDEKTSIQARRRIAPASPPSCGRVRRVEFEYERGGALAYLAAWDVHRAKVFGICERQSGIQSFDKLVDLVMSQEPYKSANRVFWVADNGSSHRGQKAVKRLRAKYANLILVNTPVHASWLNQVEIYFSVLQRKVLSPNEFSCLETLEESILSFQRYYEVSAQPFEWCFTKTDLKKLMAKLAMPIQGSTIGQIQKVA